MTLSDLDRFVARSSWLGRSLRWPLDRLPREMAMPILTGPLMAGRWIVGAGIHRCWLGTYERQKQRAIKAHLEPEMIAYDIGANAGFYTLLMARSVGSDGTVYSFEPQPENLSYLRRHLALNGVRNVVASPQAVADFVGEASFATDVDRYQGRLAASGQLRVPVVTLDHLVTTQGLPPGDLIKIDVEGAELAVLKGAENLLRRFRPVVFLATHGGEIHRECCRFLRQCGYRLRTLDGRPGVDEVDELVASTR